MQGSTDPPTVPWAFVIGLLVVGIAIAIALGYWGAAGQIGQSIPGTHSP